MSTDRIFFFIWQASDKRDCYQMKPRKGQHHIKCVAARKNGATSCWAGIEGGRTDRAAIKIPTESRVKLSFDLPRYAGGQDVI